MKLKELSIISRSTATKAVALLLTLSLSAAAAAIPASTTFRNWGLLNADGNNSHVHAVDAWKIEQGSREIVVAVVDTGIDPNHPDLKQNLWHDKATGIYGWDFVAKKANPTDPHGHGTHVAGILGATLNAAAGISGVAQKVSIMPVRYYDNNNSGKQNLDYSVKALEWAVDHGAKIINYSGGGGTYLKAEHDVLKRARDKGILVVAAAGNERSNGDLPQNAYFPCAYRDLDNIICVTAINPRNQILPSSNWGKNTVDIAAPGERILSTTPLAKGKYAYMTGTSQATAFVTGAAVLLLSRNSSLKPTEVRELIRNSADHVEGLESKVASKGKLNVAAALALLNRSKPATKFTPSVLVKAQQVPGAEKLLPRKPSAM